MSLLSQFSEVWFVDFEFQAPTGHRPTVVCMVALELHSGRRIELWQNDLVKLERAPFDTGPSSLFVAYYNSAEMSCFLALGWPMPEYLVDLFAEFRCLTNGLYLPGGNGLLGALTFYGLPTIGAQEKKEMRDLIMRGGPYSEEEHRAILDYCGSDVEALARLWEVMGTKLPPQAVLRGRYMKAAACMEWTGVPIDRQTHDALDNHWEEIQESLITRIDSKYGIYEGRTFKQEKFFDWLVANKIPWPVLDSGRIALDDDTFKDMAKSYPQIAPLRELRCTQAQLRLNKLAVGPDNRNRLILSAFNSKTGRNQPSNARFVFGMASWFRSLVQPSPANALAYVDWSQQEFGIAAALSGDLAMQKAYLSGDPYIGFAITAGAVPPDATKKSHPAVREKFKTTVLGVQYCMGPESLAMRLNISIAEARHLLGLHRKSFPGFWRWSDGAVDYAMLTGKIYTVFGWELHVAANSNPRTLRNFPMQANGAEMMRLAACLATESGLQVCCPVHDAFLIEAPIDEIDHTVARMQEIMKEASEIVLGGFPLESDAKIFRYPDRYSDPRGEQMWNLVMEILKERDPPKGLLVHS